MLPFLCQNTNSLCQMLWFMLQICHGGISVGTALRAFGLSGDQTFVFGLQFRSGSPLFPYYKFSRMDFLTMVSVAYQLWASLFIQQSSCFLPLIIYKVYIDVLNCFFANNFMATSFNSFFHTYNVLHVLVLFIQKVSHSVKCNLFNLKILLVHFNSSIALNAYLLTGK